MNKKGLRKLAQERAWIRVYPTPMSVLYDPSKPRPSVIPYEKPLQLVVREGETVLQTESERLLGPVSASEMLSFSEPDIVYMRKQLVFHIERWFNDLGVAVANEWNVTEVKWEPIPPMICPNCKASLR